MSWGVRESPGEAEVGEVVVKNARWTKEDAARPPDPSASSCKSKPRRWNPDRNDRRRPRRAQIPNYTRLLRCRSRCRPRVSQSTVGRRADAVRCIYLSVRFFENNARQRGEKATERFKDNRHPRGLSKSFELPCALGLSDSRTRVGPGSSATAHRGF